MQTESNPRAVLLFEDRSYFEGDAYRLSSHCVEDGLEMKVVEDIHDFDQLWIK